MQSKRRNSISRDTWLVATPHHVSAPLGSEVAILHLGSGMYHGLEGVGARVWQMISQPRRVADLEETLLREYEVAPDVLRRDLDRLLADLLERGLVEVRESPPHPPGATD